VTLPCSPRASSVSLETGSPPGPWTTGWGPSWSWRPFASSGRIPAHAGAVAVATSQEEIGFSGGGARSAAFHLEPDAALVVDVTFATDVPDGQKKEVGEHSLGGGPVITRGSAVHPQVAEHLLAAAEAQEIAVTLHASPRGTYTDADGIFLVRSGVPTGVVSIPNRYMHSPSEMVSLGDLEKAAQLLAAFVRSLDSDTSFVQE